jgi:archaellum component FlaG (FlaF/FlaG flagellin family)
MQKSGGGRLFDHPMIQASPLLGRVQDRNLKVASHIRGDFEVLNGPS